MTTSPPIPGHSRYVCSTRRNCHTQSIKMRNSIWLLTILFSSGGICAERQLCHVERGHGPDWHYRTQIPPLMEAKCWYVGPRMKPRNELYWAETPVIPPNMSTFEPRWKGETQ